MIKTSFIKSCIDPKDFFKDKRSQICFVGRSNVGKSSLINALANNSKLAKTSKTPGRTKLINFFDFEKFVVVDLPGYGYAKADNKTREQIYNLILNCLNYNEKLTCVVQLCNIEVLTEDDQKMSIFLEKTDLKHLVVLTKSDKVAKSTFFNNKKKYIEFLKIKEDQIIDISCKTRYNIDRLLNMLTGIINNESNR